MFSSDGRQITYKGRPALLFVLRNNGECWGRLVVGGEELDVCTTRDHYDDDDATALAAFERAARRGRVEATAGWLGFDKDPPVDR
ncbi:MAG: hypothetical protein IT499_12040 [Rubrivivax sp.]|nr:hypothetical protein [Rubrivivax sp.]MCL4699157.1 hypothetical protein [Burkholderiaceae bacterium]